MLTVTFTKPVHSDPLTFNAGGISNGHRYLSGYVRTPGRAGACRWDQLHVELKVWHAEGEPWISCTRRPERSTGWVPLTDAGAKLVRHQVAQALRNQFDDLFAERMAIEAGGRDTEFFEEDIARHQAFIDWYRAVGEFAPIFRTLIDVGAAVLVPTKRDANGRCPEVRAPRSRDLRWDYLPLMFNVVAGGEIVGFLTEKSFPVPAHLVKDERAWA